MNWSKKSRKIWHDLYYAFCTDRGEKFALTCQEVAEFVDTGSASSSLAWRARVKLHLSLCQACTNYKVMTNWLKKCVFDMLELKLKNSNSLDESLVKKFSR